VWVCVCVCVCVVGQVVKCSLFVGGGGSLLVKWGSTTKRESAGNLKHNNVNKKRRERERERERESVRKRERERESVRERLSRCLVAELWSNCGIF